MEDLKYFIVQVKLEMETDVCDKAGNPKLKKWSFMKNWVLIMLSNILLQRQ